MKVKCEMRRPEKLISDLGHIEFILTHEPVGVLSLSKNNLPYAVPVNFYYNDSRIYLHSSKVGQKVSYIMKNPRVCFLVLHAVDGSDEECGGALNYESVLCFGKATYTETSTAEVLSKLGKKYQTCSEVSEEDCQKTAMIIVDIEEVSAKRGYQL